MLKRRYPIGAEVTKDGVFFRVWAPKRRHVSVVIEGGGEHALAPEGGGYFSGTIARAPAGTRYRFRLDQGKTLYPDPASRFQPDGPHGPSEIVDPFTFRWSDAGWAGVKLEGQILYEMHIGTFTPEGTWAAAAAKLPLLKDIGVTVLEMMPVNEFPGEFGWGYDGVDLFAPTRLYGAPDDLRRFVDAAHGLGMGVLLDVVYNHLGPDGNYLACFSDGYQTDRYKGEWGNPINFDGPDSGPVREFFAANAAYWIDEFHFDGLRIDATQSMFDASDEHVLANIVRAARDAAGERSIMRTATGSMRFGTTTSTTRPWSRSPAGTRPTTRITRERRRNSSRRQNTAICSRGSSMPIKASAAGRRGSISPPPPSSSLSRTMIRSPTPPAACASINSQAPAEHAR
ncbi:MAG: treZ [Microvirga sp.]|nr:treZ [Microvirga sp.]